MHCVLYFYTHKPKLDLFLVNGTIWWLILTVTWLLAAGYKWGSEAIEERHVYYHAAAWGLPAIQVLIVIVSNKIEGDNIAGKVQRQITAFLYEPVNSELKLAVLKFLRIFSPNCS